MEPDILARIFALPVSKLGRRLVLAEVLGEPVSLRRRKARREPPPTPRTPPPEPTKGG